MLVISIGSGGRGLNDQTLVKAAVFELNPEG